MLISADYVKTKRDNDNESLRVSICIPMYNRSAYLRECLESIVSSAKGHEEQLEIEVGWI